MRPTLRSGETIAVFSPSYPITAEVPVRYERGRDYLVSRGFTVVEGTLTGKSDHYRSGTIRERVDEVNALIRDPEVRCMMSAIGGTNSNSLLPYLDYEAFADDPKVVIGTSDVTAILLALYAKTGVTTYYGPAMVASFGEFPPLVDVSFERMMDAIGDESPRPLTLPNPQEWTEERIPWLTQDRAKTCQPNQLRTLRPGSAQGRLIGGNLNTMSAIWNTPYMPQIREGDILLIEDSMKDIATVERLFALLKCSNVFDAIGGLILGKHELFDDAGTGRTPSDVLLEVLDGEGAFPILADYDCCHTHPMLTLPIGGQVHLNADEQTVTLLE